MLKTVRKNLTKNTIEIDDEQINFNGAVSEYNGSYSVTIEDKEGTGEVI